MDSLACVLATAVTATTTWGWWQHHRRKQRMRARDAAAWERGQELIARVIFDMPSGHPEHITPSLPDADEAWLKAVSASLGPECELIAAIHAHRPHEETP